MRKVAGVLFAVALVAPVGVAGHAGAGPTNPLTTCTGGTGKATGSCSDTSGIIGSLAT